jgi:hypothetical protein
VGRGALVAIIGPSFNRTGKISAGALSIHSVFHLGAPESLLRYTDDGPLGAQRADWALREKGCDAIKSLLYLDRNGLWGRVCTSGIPEKHLAGVWSGALA